jgi:two-component system response regulator AtoC
MGFFTFEARDMLIKYSYPGNVRELEYLIQRTVTLARGTVVRPSDLPPEVRHIVPYGRETLSQRLDSVERNMLLLALEKSGWVQTRAAEILGINERVLRYKMNKHGIKR